MVTRDRWRAHGERLITCDIRRGAAGKVTGGSSPLRADRRSRYLPPLSRTYTQAIAMGGPLTWGQLEPISSLGQLATIDSPLRVACVPEPIAQLTLGEGRSRPGQVVSNFPLHSWTNLPNACFFGLREERWTIRKAHRWNQTSNLVAVEATVPMTATASYQQISYNTALLNWWVAV